jgi:hypothetical protein
LIVTVGTKRDQILEIIVAELGP